jgi:hypothetical protein
VVHSPEQASPAPREPHQQLPEPRQAQGPGCHRPTILVIIWHLLASRTARFRELGAGYYARRIDKDK